MTFAEASVAVPAEEELPHVLVVDDDRRLRTLLQRYLAEHGFRITTAADAAEAKHILTLFEVDLIVLDIMLPGQSGLELTRELRHETTLPVLLLTAMGEAEHRISGLESGADDYLAKPFEPRELVLRIHAILRRIARDDEPDDSALRFGAYTFDRERGILQRSGDTIRLTSGELSLLRLLAADAGKPVSRDALSEGSAVGNTRTVDVQITRLRRKIEDDPRRPHHIQTVRGKGYALIID